MSSPDHGPHPERPSHTGPRGHEVPTEHQGHQGHKAHQGLDRLRRATGHSAAGLRAALRHESAFRQELAVALLLLPASFWLGRGWVEVALLAGSVLAVLVVELLNSAVEATVDRISFDAHELSKRAKDYGSAAVMLSLIACASVWAAALWQRFGG